MVRRLIGQPLLSRTGDRLGAIHDVVVRLAEREDPLVAGLVVRIGQRTVFVPIAEVTPLATPVLRLLGDRLDVRSFERRPREILLGSDLLGHHVISVTDAQLVHVRDVQLAYQHEIPRAVAVVVDVAPLAARLLPQWMGGSHAPHTLPWSGIEPLLGHVPSARWRLPLGRLARLHPAHLADLVETASPTEGEEIIRTVGQDRDLEADVFEELAPAYQIAHIRSWADAEVAELLTTMAPDDAADLLLQLEHDRQQRILGRLPLVTLRKVRPLLGYNPETAGGLMSTDYLTAPQDMPVGAVIEAVRASRLPPGVAETVYVVDTMHRLVGAFLVSELLRRDPAETVGGTAIRPPVSVHPDADIPQIALAMTDFNLTMLPVVDAALRVVGVIAVDDLLEVMLPAEWRALVGHQPPPMPAPRASAEMEQRVPPAG
jgi:CBS domain-containing protein